MRLDDEFDLGLDQSFAQLLELLRSEHYSKVRNRHIILIHMVAMLLRLEFWGDEAEPQEVVVESVADGGGSAIDLLGLQQELVEVVREGERVGGEGDFEFTDLHAGNLKGSVKLNEI